MKKACLWALLLSFLLSGCAARQESRTVFCMDTVMTLRVSGPEAAQALERVEAELYRLDALLGPDAPESAEAQALLERAAEISRMTGGAFDCTLGAVSALWGFGTEQARIPSEDELAAALAVSGWEKTAAPGRRIDFGAIGKGYAAAQARRILTDAGVSSALLSLGGNVLALGRKPDGSRWQVGLQDPDDPEAYFGVLSAEDESVVTSGGYQRYFEQDGVRYWHILDPKTGRPARSGLLSVTVVCRDDALADALSTALFVLGAEDGAALWRAHPDLFDAVFLTDDREILVTQGLETRFSAETACEVIRP